MKIIIDIPDEFEQHWNKDRFKDSLQRLKMDANYLAGLYEEELTDMLVDAFQDAQIVEVAKNE